MTIFLKKWYDENLKWDPIDHGNQTKMVFTARDIWTPGLFDFTQIKIS